MRIKLAAAMLAALSVVTPATAQECNKPLKMLFSLPMTPMGRSNIMSVPVSLNGVDKQFVFDTGGMVLQMSPDVADELKLTRLESSVALYATDGTVTRKYVVVEKFAMGKFAPARIELQVSPNAGIEGIFTPMVFKTIDFDMDFAARKLNVISGDHCDGKVIYWPAKAAAVVPITFSSNHITVPVTVDGHDMIALVDTGASTSTLRLDMARRAFNLTPESPDMKNVGHVGTDENAAIYEYPFKTLSFGGVTVTNPRIRILTDVVSKNADKTLETGSSIKRISDSLTLPQVIIGMDVLQKLHVYLALGEKKLYLTEASTPAGMAGATPAPAAGQ